MTSLSTDRWVKRFSVLVPREIREHFLADLIAERADMRVRGVPRWRMTLATLKELLDGAAQHAPLRPRLPTSHHEQPAIAARSAQVGWIVWRLSGLCLFAGLVSGVTPLFVAGVFMLAASFASVAIVAATGQAPLAELQGRLVTGVLVGTLTVLAATIAFGGFSVVLLGLAGLFGSVGLGKFAMGALVFVATSVACAVSVSGWVPEEWYPKRLVRTRNEDHVERAAEETVDRVCEPVGFRERNAERQMVHANHR